MLDNAALVLEGGSLRGMFTAGVLDVMMENELRFGYVNGVSAGALNAINYVAGQIGRSAQVNIDFVRDKRYLGLKNLLFHGGIFNFDFLFGEIADTLIPFDTATFQASGQILECVATALESGEAQFFRRGETPDFMLAARASASMPLLSRVVWIEGKPYLDGGAALPIAYRRALELGYQKVVVVLTREAGYRKNPQDKLFARACDRLYADYPAYLDTVHRIPAQYNEMQEEMDALSAEGRIYIIRPGEPVAVGRVERDTEKLSALYQKGRERTQAQFTELQNYLQMEKRPVDKTPTERD